MYPWVLTYDFHEEARKRPEKNSQDEKQSIIYGQFSPLTEHIIHWEVSNEASFHLSSFFILKYDADRVVWETWTTSTLLAWVEPPKLLHIYVHIAWSGAFLNFWLSDQNVKKFLVLFSKNFWHSVQKVRNAPDQSNCTYH